MVIPLVAGMVIRDALPRDAFVVTQVLSAAFAGSAVGRRLGPDPKSQRLSALGHIGGLVSETITAGIVRVVEEGGETVGAEFSPAMPAVPSSGMAGEAPRTWQPDSGG